MKKEWQKIMRLRGTMNIVLADIIRWRDVGNEMFSRGLSMPIYTTSSGKQISVGQINQFRVREETLEAYCEYPEWFEFSLESLVSVAIMAKFVDGTQTPRENAIISVLVAESAHFAKCNW